jgi:hypothetical protein
LYDLQPGDFSVRRDAPAERAPAAAEQLGGFDAATLNALAAATRALAQQDDVPGVLQMICTLGVETVLGVDEASITVRRPNGRMETIAPSSAVADRADALQYQVGAGPCVDVVRGLHERIRVDDLAADERWPELRRLADELSIHSVLSLRISAEDDDSGVRGLNLYARTPGAFLGLGELTGELYASHAAVALRAARRHEQVLNLHRALETNRDIGVAMGIVMAHRLVTREQAYDLLRRASQHSQRKLADIAAEVAETGVLEFDTAVRPPRGPRPTPGAEHNGGRTG